MSLGLGGFGGPGKGPSLGDYHAYKSTRPDADTSGAAGSGGEPGNGDSGDAGNLLGTLLLLLVSIVFLWLMVELKSCIAG